MKAKKLIVSAMAVSLLLSLGACAKSEEDKNQETLKQLGLVKDYGTATVEEYNAAYSAYQKTTEKYDALEKEAEDFKKVCEAGPVPPEGWQPSACGQLLFMPLNIIRPEKRNTKGATPEELAKWAHSDKSGRLETESLIQKLQQDLDAAKAEYESLTQG